MRRLLAAVAVVLGVLAAPAVAQAKEISKVSVCGSSGECTTYGNSDFKSLMFLADDAGPTDPPAAAAPWYRVRFTVDHGGVSDSWTVAYVPTADRLRVGEEGGGFAWVAVSPRTAAVLKRAAGELPAFPKARLRGLRIDEALAPAARTQATREPIDSSTTPWGWIAGGAVLVLVTVAWILRRRRHVEMAPA